MIMYMNCRATINEMMRAGPETKDYFGVAYNIKHTSPFRSITFFLCLALVCRAFTFIKYFLMHERESYTQHKAHTQHATTACQVPHNASASASVVTAFNSAGPSRAKILLDAPTIRADSLAALSPDIHPHFYNTYNNNHYNIEK